MEAGHVQSVKADVGAAMWDYGAGGDDTWNFFALPHGIDGSDGTGPLLLSFVTLEFCVHLDNLRMCLVENLRFSLSSGMTFNVSCIETLADDFIMAQQLKIRPRARNSISESPSESE